jgi:hypothetical protein
LTVTVAGLPDAPVAVTVSVPDRGTPVVFAVCPTVMVPLFVPLAPDWIVNHGAVGLTAAVQFIVPLRAFATANVVEPAPLPTLRCEGDTESCARAPGCLSATVIGLFDAPGAVTVITALRVMAVVLAL